VCPLCGNIEGLHVIGESDSDYTINNKKQEQQDIYKLLSDISYTHEVNEDQLEQIQNILTGKIQELEYNFGDTITDETLHLAFDYYGPNCYSSFETIPVDDERLDNISGGNTFYTNEVLFIDDCRYNDIINIFKDDLKTDSYPMTIRFIEPDEYGETTNILKNKKESV